MLYSTAYRILGVLQTPAMRICLPFVSVGSYPPRRGLKRKIGYIDSATRMGQKNKIEQEFEIGEEIVHKEVEIMQHLFGHQGIVTLKAVYEDAQYIHLVMKLCSGGQLFDQMRKD
nr:serine/threonine-protein kinase PEPKR2-like [Tanacetum cinerariifolium]